MKIKVKDLKFLIERFLKEQGEEEEEVEEVEEEEEEPSEDEEAEDEEPVEDEEEEEAEPAEPDKDAERKEKIISDVEKESDPRIAFRDFMDDVALLGEDDPEFKIRIPTNLQAIFPGKKEVNYQEIVSAHNGGKARAGVHSKIV